MSEFDDKHLKIMEAILPYARKTPQKNLTQFNISTVSRNTKVLFMLFPEWAVKFPPYNIARLVAVTKRAGYYTSAIDANIESKKASVNWGLEHDPWTGSMDWIWGSDEYWKLIHPHLEPLYQSYFDYIEQQKIDVVGFSLYYCNKQPTFWFAQQLRKRFPNIVTLVGGPDCHMHVPPGDLFDIAVIGEAERNILDALEYVETNGRPSEQIVLSQKDGERLDLDNLPWADYSHFDFDAYEMPNGVNAEFSRGCTAKCVFCSETHFWKYRGRSAGSTLQEIITLNEQYGVDYVWFLDSLVNGNTQELRAFALGIAASGKTIKWTGYARCDQKMDAAYYDDLAAGGCHMLSYGVESGSNSVLKDMDKRITVDIVERNLEDGLRVGILAHANWIVGFPTETLFHFYEGLQFIWRNQHRMMALGTGHGFTEPPDTILSQNSEAYGFIKAYYEDNWTRGDFTNTKTHRLIRLITTNILLKQCTSSTGSEMNNFDVDKYCSLETSSSVKKTLVYEPYFDFQIIKPNINPFADSVVNEFWPLLRVLWRTHGAYRINITLDPQHTMPQFGTRLVSDFSANLKFYINTSGRWQAQFKFCYQQQRNAWRYSDYSRHDTLSASRARRLAIPGSTGAAVFDGDKYNRDQALVEDLQHVDFSFDFEYTSKGVWQ